eukprot:843908-Alexandrium_andersonii.AAC.1
MYVDRLGPGGQAEQAPSSQAAGLALPPGSCDLREPSLHAAMDPAVGNDYSDSALVAPWPVATPEDACGCMVRQRLEDWARAQA